MIIDPHILRRTCACLALLSPALIPQATSAAPLLSVPEGSIIIPADPNSDLTIYQRFGGAVAVGDFNDDGFDDLAVGDPEADVGFNQGTGLVDVYYGSANGLGSLRSLQLSAELPLPEPCRNVANDDHFGAALTSGDWDDDGLDDLAVGIPFRDVRNIAGSLTTDTGAVQIFWGALDDFDGNKIFDVGPCLTRGSGIVQSSVSLNSHFGAALTTGSFNVTANDIDDLVIGAPGAQIGGPTGAGEVYVLYGSRNGLFDESAPQRIHMDSLRVMSDLNLFPGVDDRFGAALASGDLITDGQPCDLAIGVPGRDAGFEDSGAVVTINGCGGGLNEATAEFITANIGPDNIPRAGARFGSSVSIGNFDCEGGNDLAIGIPHQPDGGIEPGAVIVAYSLDGASNQYINYNQMPQELHTFSRFGTAMVTIPGDGDCDHLAVGAPGVENFGSWTVAMRGSAQGLVPATAQTIQTLQPGAPANFPAAADGSALAIGRFDGDRQWLVTTRPGEIAPDTGLPTGGTFWMLPEWRCELFCDGFESGDLDNWSVTGAQNLGIP